LRLGAAAKAGSEELRTTTVRVRARERTILRMTRFLLMLLLVVDELNERSQKTGVRSTDLECMTVLLLHGTEMDLERLNSGGAAALDIGG
jgi:hypothetical protein